MPPPREWVRPDCDDAQWTEGVGGFGPHRTPGAVVRTLWCTDRIWLRRRIEVPDPRHDRLWLRLHHEEDVERDLHGRRVLRRSGVLTSDEMVPLPPEMAREIAAGSLTIDVTCRQTRGGQYRDVGLLREEPR